jgi:hypothetical protein
MVRTPRCESELRARRVAIEDGALGRALMNSYWRAIATRNDCHLAAFESKADISQVHFVPLSDVQAPRTRLGSRLSFQTQTIPLTA